VFGYQGSGPMRRGRFFAEPCPFRLGPRSALR
jgi:hypothetical protein